MKAEQITDRVAYHAEGPVWWPDLRALRFVDMLDGAVVTLDSDGDATRTDVRATTSSDIAACLRPTEAGAILATQDSIWISWDDLADFQVRTRVFDDPQVRFNDGGCDPWGNFYVGTMAYDSTPGAGRLYRITKHTGEVEVVVEGVTISNGIDFSPDARRAYYNDTATHTTWLFDSEAAGLSDLRPFIDHGEDNPDGLTVDADGGIWVAFWGAGEVRHFTPDGVLDAVVEVGATQASACTFGGDDYATLFITTSRENLPADAEPGAGAIWAAQPGVCGRAPLKYRT